MIIVLDTNAFYSDARATGGWLSAIVDGAEKGDFRLVVPETVVMELERQYPERMREATERANAALRKARMELRRLGMASPDELVADQSLLDGYSQTLRARLTGSGRRIEPHPDDLGTLVEWAVHKRKPYKDAGDDAGNGSADAAIWLTVLALAADDEVVLVSTNTGDFGDGGSPAALDPTLAGDLVRRGHPADRVRLVTSVGDLVREIVEPRAEAGARAERVLHEAPAAERLRAAIADALLSASLPQAALRLGVDLEDDPEVVEHDVDLASAEVLDAREPGDGALLMEVSVLADVTLSMAIYRADAAMAAPWSPVEIVDFDLSERYVEGQATIAVRLALEIAADLDGQDAEVELLDAERLSDEEELQHRLDSGAADVLGEELVGFFARAAIPVEGYVPAESLETGVEHALLERVDLPERVVVASVNDVDRGAIDATLDFETTGDVDWQVSAPSPFDVDRHGSLAEGPDEAPWLHAVATGEPLLLTVLAQLGRDGRWRSLVVEARLDPEERARRIADDDAET